LSEAGKTLQLRPKEHIDVTKNAPEIVVGIALK